MVYYYSIDDGGLYYYHVDEIHFINHKIKITRVR